MLNRQSFTWTQFYTQDRTLSQFALLLPVDLVHREHPDKFFWMKPSGFLPNSALFWYSGFFCWFFFYFLAPRVSASSMSSFTSFLSACVPQENFSGPDLGTPVSLRRCTGGFVFRLLNSDQSCQISQFYFIHVKLLPYSHNSFIFVSTTSSSKS